MQHPFNIAVPGDIHVMVASKEMDKIFKKYQDLARELCQIWQVKGKLH